MNTLLKKLLVSALFIVIGFSFAAITYASDDWRISLKDGPDEKNDSSIPLTIINIQIEMEMEVTPRMKGEKVVTIQTWQHMEKKALVTFCGLKRVKIYGDDPAVLTLTGPNGEKYQAGKYRDPKTGKMVDLGKVITLEKPIPFEHVKKTYDSSGKLIKTESITDDEANGLNREDWHVASFSRDCFRGLEPVVWSNGPLPITGKEETPGWTGGVTIDPTSGGKVKPNPPIDTDDLGLRQRFYITYYCIMPPYASPARFEKTPKEIRINHNSVKDDYSKYIGSDGNLIIPPGTIAIKMEGNIRGRAFEPGKKKGRSFRGRTSRKIKRHFGKKFGLRAKHLPFDVGKGSSEAISAFFPHPEGFINYVQLPNGKVEVVQGPYKDVAKRIEELKKKYGIVVKTFRHSVNEGSIFWEHTVPQEGERTGYEMGEDFEKPKQDKRPDEGKLDMAGGKEVKIINNGENNMQVKIKRRLPAHVDESPREKEETFTIVPKGKEAPEGHFSGSADLPAGTYEVEIATLTGTAQGEIGGKKLPGKNVNKIKLDNPVPWQHFKREKEGEEYTPIAEPDSVPLPARGYSHFVTWDMGYIHWTRKVALSSETEVIELRAEPDRFSLKPRGEMIEFNLYASVMNAGDHDIEPAREVRYGVRQESSGMTVIIPPTNTYYYQVYIDGRLLSEEKIDMPDFSELLNTSFLRNAIANINLVIRLPQGFLRPGRHDVKFQFLAKDEKRDYKNEKITHIYVEEGGPSDGIGACPVCGNDPCTCG